MITLAMLPWATSFKEARLVRYQKVNVNLMNKVGYDAISVGNREFDYQLLCLAELNKSIKHQVPLLLATENLILFNVITYYNKFKKYIKIKQKTVDFCKKK